MWFDGWSDIWRVVIVTSVAYAAVIVILRGAGKRVLSKLNAFDFIVTVAFGSILASITLTTSISISEGVAAFGALALLQVIVTWLSNKSDTFAKALRSEPKLLLSDGNFHDEALANERVTCDEVEAAIRKDGHGKVEDVTAVVLESDGTLSVICQGKAADCTALRSVLRPGETSL